MIIKKVISVVFISISTIFFINAKQVLTNQEQQAIDDFLIFKLELTIVTNEDTLTRIENYKNQIFKKNYSNYSKEVQLILDNFILMEKFSYLYFHEANECTLKNIIIPQKEINDNWFSSHNRSTINKWLYSTSADVFSWSLQFLSKSDVFKYAVTAQDYYKEALKNDPNMAFALFGIGQWNIYVPTVFGGGKNKAISQFKQTVEVSRNRSEKFYSYVLLSQAYFDKDNKKQASITLEKALKLVPNSSYVHFMQLLNQENSSYFEYMTNKTSLENKVSNNSKIIIQTKDI
jgi:tetratricopeptide (TPR) repeat protein